MQLTQHVQGSVQRRAKQMAAKFTALLVIRARVCLQLDEFPMKCKRNGVNDIRNGKDQQW
jgi:hypothetical protein